MSDELIGGIEPREIVIVPYHHDWVTRYEGERARIRNALGERALRIDHVVSTAVPGLDVSSARVQSRSTPSVFSVPLRR